MSAGRFPTMTGEEFHRDFRDAGAVGPLIVWPLLIFLTVYTYYATHQIGLGLLALLITLVVVREYNVYLLWRVRVERRLEGRLRVTVRLRSVLESTSMPWCSRYSAMARRIASACGIPTFPFSAFSPASRSSSRKKLTRRR
jgi:hypothetical protein